MNGKRIELRGGEPGHVNLWGLVLVAIQRTDTTVRLVVILAMIGLLGLLGVHLLP